jgi:hypothetical protein
VTSADDFETVFLLLKGTLRMAKKKKKTAKKKAYKMEGVRVPDWPEIKGYFSDVDRQHMLAVTGGSLDLHDCESVLANAADIFQEVSAGNMPPGNPWSPDKINGFFSWWKSNPTCP